MRWSKLKQLIEQRFAESVSGHVELFVTRYKDSHDEAGRWALRIGGKEVGGIGDYSSEGRFWDLKETGEFSDKYCRDINKVQTEAGSHDLVLFNDSLYNYLNLTINDAIQSKDIVIKSLAMLDKRLGKRRLREIVIDESWYPLVKECFNYRCEMEKL
jgi:hypothetical protein